MELVLLVGLGSVTILVGVIIGVMLSERSTKIGTYTRQILIVATILTILFVFKHIDTRTLNFMVENSEFMNTKIMRAVNLEVKVFIFLYMFFLTSHKIKVNFKHVSRRVSNVK